MKLFYTAILIVTHIFTLKSHAQTSVEKADGRWSFVIDEKPFPIKGVTFGFDKDTGNYDKYFEDLKFLGVNSIRTWGSGENTSKLLDAAQKYEIKVMVGIWMRHGRPGMEADDSFDYLEDRKGMEDMYHNAISKVQKFKDHPAVLTWGIGNEVYLNMATDPEKEAYSKLLERICSEIKKIDPNHPITSVEAWTFGIKWWEQYVPSIDIYGINCYGPGANVLPDELAKLGATKPYVITEFGVMGEWDVREDSNGIKIEPDDQQKYDAIKSGYQQWIKPKPSCLGVYVFHYSDGHEHLAPWLLTHFKGKKRPQYWAVREAYTGQTPINNVPAIQSFELPSEETNGGEWVPVSLNVSDFEGDELTVSFSYNQRTGSRKRRDQILPLNHRGNLLDGLEIELPKEHGAIKVYANVADGENIGIATTSIQVIDEEAEAKKYLVPKVGLPFYVYKDGNEMPYTPTAYMGNYKAMSVDLLNSDQAYSGTAALEINYDEVYDWYGLGLVDPPNDWGSILGGFDITGATKFSFWAKADRDDLKATIGFGLIDTDKPFPDTAKKSIEVKLTTKWKQYSFSTKKLDLSCIRSGLVIFSSASRFPHKIYLDDVIFE